MSLNTTELLLSLNASAAALEAAAGERQTNMDNVWMLIAGFLVFWMHSGFAMLEAGSVRHRNAVNILFKNLATISIGGIFFYLIGYGFAAGDTNVESDSFEFIGAGNFGLSQSDEKGDRALFFFQTVFAATAATIVSGACAERINLLTYFGLAAYLVSIVYPIVVHWVWFGGFLSAFRDDGFLFESEGGIGTIDFAGSTVVHMTGGVAAFWAAFFLGPRAGRFEGVNMAPHNVLLQGLGVFILWFGWYGFNCGSTLVFEGVVTAKVAVTTTLSPSAAVLTGTVVGKLITGKYDIGIALNCALAGLVGITAGCPVVPDWAAIVIGAIAALVYIGASKLMRLIKIDDPVDAIAVHGFCGAWGTLAVGIFSETKYIDIAYGTTGAAGNSNAYQFLTQLTCVGSVLGWVTLMMVPPLVACSKFGILRVSESDEQEGLDASEHGASAFVGGDVVKGGAAVSPSEY